MNDKIQHLITKFISRKGIWITLGLWIILTGLLSSLAPSSSDYKVSSVSKLLPDSAPSVIAEEKIEEYFSNSDETPAILVFEANNNTVDIEALKQITSRLNEETVSYMKGIVPLHELPDVVLESFIAEDKTAAMIPMTFLSGVESKDLRAGISDVESIVNEETDEMSMHVTGPAGIAVDTTELFSRADLVLIFSTVGIILILLIITYRSPLLALIPLLAAGIVQQVVKHLLGLLGYAGVELANQSLSIMMILLFAVVIDYSLFIFSRFKEELQQEESKYNAMQRAMSQVGVPIFYSGITILGAMIILLLAQFGDYKNFAPIFSVSVFVVLLAALTLVPALFTIFGRTAFWPKIPRVNEEKKQPSAIWSFVGSKVAKKPVLTAIATIVVLIAAAANLPQMNYEFNTMKSFPEDMPSRIGYDILETKFSQGDLAPTTVLFESKDEITEEEHDALEQTLSEEEAVANVQMLNLSYNKQAVTYQLTFDGDPYDQSTMDHLKNLMNKASEIKAASDVKGELYFAGETAYSVDNRDVSNRDLIVIMIFETIFIFAMLIFLTDSYKLPVYMMGTILLSFAAALGLGSLLVDLFFDISTISNRVPVYAFVFLVALGIDYNIFLVSRFMEERKNYVVKEAVERAVAHTGGVISSAGIVLAATFAVLMTQPVEDLFVFGFIVAIGILLDTFIVRGILMPSLLILFEKNKNIRIIRKSKKEKNS